MTDYCPALTPGDERIVIVGGPMAGKSTLALQLGERFGFPVYCGDPRSTVRRPPAGVHYLPEGLDWPQGSAHVASWLAQPGPWVVEGHVAARALRKHLGAGGVLPDRVLLLPQPHPEAYLAQAQRPLMDGVLSVWAEVETQLRHITQVLTLDDVPQWDPLAGVRDLARQLDQV